MNLYIYGAGSIGCELVDIAEKINLLKARWSIVTFVDDINKDRLWYGRRVCRFEEMLSDSNEYECIVALGEPANRQLLHQKLLKNGVSLATLIDPSAEISKSASIGPGCIIGPHSFVSCNTKVEDNAMLEVHTIVGHDIFIGKHSVISSCSVVGGNSYIGSESFVGLNSTIKEGSRIGNRCIIGMGSCVFNNIDDGYIALGNPARPVRTNDERRIFKS